jgi:hypothetical protein
VKEEQNQEWQRCKKRKVGVEYHRRRADNTNNESEGHHKRERWKKKIREKSDQ